MQVGGVAGRQALHVDLRCDEVAVDLVDALRDDLPEAARGVGGRRGHGRGHGRLEGRGGIQRRDGEDG